MNIQEAYQSYMEYLMFIGSADKTLKNYKSSLKSFVDLVGEVDICDVNFEFINLWRDLMKEIPYKPSTISGNISKLRCVVEHCNKKGYCKITKDDIPVPKVPRQDPSWLEPNEIRQIINGAQTDRDRCLISLLFSTGCRIGELIGVDITDLHDGYMIVHGKGDKYRPVFYDAAAKRYLDLYIESRTDDLPYLFTSGQKKRLTVSRAQQILHTSSESLGKRVYPHLLRHSYASNAAANGMPITILKEILGHENITTTMMYVHSNLNTRQEAYNRYAVDY